MKNNLECGIWTKNGICLVPIEKIDVLPLYHREIIPTDYLDAMGHMNIRWYMALYDKTGWGFFKALGLDETYYKAEKAGVFALSHFIRYYSEIKAGQTIAIRTRLLDRTEKRFHFMHFMINETSGQLSSTLEGMGTHADLIQRKSAPMPPAIADKFTAKLAVDQALDWEAPLCGAIRV